MLAFQLLAPGGVLLTYSCSGLMEQSLFQKIVADAALDAGRDAQILELLSQASDHPIGTATRKASTSRGWWCAPADPGDDTNLHCMNVANKKAAQRAAFSLSVVSTTGDLPCKGLVQPLQQDTTSILIDRITPNATASLAERRPASKASMAASLSSTTLSPSTGPWV
jgi:hypothetical protein